MVLGSGLKKVQGKQQGAARAGCSMKEGEQGLKHINQKGNKPQQDLSLPFRTLLSQQLVSRPGRCSRLALARGKGVHSET